MFRTVVLYRSECDIQSDERLHYETSLLKIFSLRCTIYQFMKCFKSYILFWGIRSSYVCMDLKRSFKVHNLVFVYARKVKLGQMVRLNVIFYVVCQIIDWLNIETRPSFPRNFGMAYKKLNMITYHVA